MKQAVFLFALLFVNASYGQWSKTPMRSESISISSTVNKRNYKLLVSLPANYSNQKKYPVLYFLDGYYAAPIAQEAMKVLKNETQEFITVSIAGDESHDYDWLVNRWTDYTFTKLPKVDSAFTKIWNISSPGLISGGGETFYKIMKDEMIPMIERKYSTNQERGLAGHSLSGLFVAHVLFKGDGVFTKFGINSPSFLMWENDILAVEQAFAASHATLNAKVFLSIGGLESSADMANLNKFEAMLKKYEGMHVENVQFKDETHSSVIPAMISRTLRTLYSRKK